MTSHLLCAMFAKALCANIGRNFPCVRNDVIYSFWKKNNGEYNFPMNCVWENNMKLNSLVAAHIIFLGLCVCGGGQRLAMLRSAYAHMSQSVIFHPFSLVHSMAMYWDPGCKLLVLISIFNVLYGT